MSRSRAPGARRVVRFTGDDIIRAMKPLIAERLGVTDPGRHWDIVTTDWSTRPLPRPDRELPPGKVPLTVDVEFTLERRAERESS